jgi:hypothetical protein
LRYRKRNSVSSYCLLGGPFPHSISPEVSSAVFRRDVILCVILTLLPRQLISLDLRQFSSNEPRVVTAITAINLPLSIYMTSRLRNFRPYCKKTWHYSTRGLPYFMQLERMVRREAHNLTTAQSFCEPIGRVPLRLRRHPTNVMR